jgi:hypothetical protein
VLLLVLGINPYLTLSELDALVTRTATRIPLPGPSEHAEVADPHDLLPYGRDVDGHDAKHGYGRLHAIRACLAAADPFAYAMISMGEEFAARKWLALRDHERRLNFCYSNQLAWWAARALVTDTSLLHSMCVVVRHARLVADHPERCRAHYPGALVQQLAVLGRALLGNDRADTPIELATEMRDLVELTSSLNRVESDALELAAYSLASDLWTSGEPVSETLPLKQQARVGGRRSSPIKAPDSGWKTA